MKHHAFAFRREGVIPFPEMLTLLSAAENDLAVLKTKMEDSLNNIFANRIYSNFFFS